MSSPVEHPRGRIAFHSLCHREGVVPRKLRSPHASPTGHSEDIDFPVYPNVWRHMHGSDLGDLYLGCVYSQQNVSTSHLTYLDDNRRNK